MISLLAAVPLILTPALPPQPQEGGDPAPDQAVVQGEEEIPTIQDLGNHWVLTFAGTEAQTGQPTPPAKGVTLEQFIKLCQEVTGTNFVYTQETAGLLKSTTIKMLGSKEVPKDDFYSFFQIIMIIHKFVCSEIGPKHLGVVVVTSLESAARNNLKGDALYIEPEEIEDYADHPATLVSAVLHLPNLDVRILTNALRGLTTDPNTMNVVPVPESNSVIMTGFGSNIAGLARMLRLMDRVSKPEDPILPQFEVIPLEYAAADEIADTLEELLEASRRVQQGQARQGAQGATAPLQQQGVETKIMVHPSTNSLLVMAMPDDMPRILELVARLDIDVIERERNYHFVSLENADAEDLASVLEDFLQDASRIESGNVPGQGGRGQGQTTSSRSEIAVVPDPATNALLIAASRSRFQEVQDLITVLDERQDQVLIETALIELSGNDLLEIGVELGGAKLPPTDDATGQTYGYGGFGVADFGLGTYVDNDGDGIPDVKVPNINSGLTAGILDGRNFSLPFLVSALQERRDTNVLNIPSVLVNNNGNATVKTLNERPKTTITTNGQGQTQENFDGYEEAGITLEISPTISASNYLRLKITLEVSNFEGAFVGSIPPPRTTRNLDTIVNVPDGDTMVIGGIIVDNKTEEKDQVPILGDLPIVGVLFRKSTDSEDRTTLYFFVTPHIMHDREFADLAAYSYKKKLEAADTIGADRIRIIDPRFGTEDGSLDLQGFDVPVYQPPTRGEVDQNDLGIDNGEVNRMLDSTKKD